MYCYLFINSFVTILFLIEIISSKTVDANVISKDALFTYSRRVSKNVGRLLDFEGRLIQPPDWCELYFYVQPKVQSRS